MPPKQRRIAGGNVLDFPVGMIERDGNMDAP